MGSLNFVKLLENSINEPGLGWTLCFIGEDQSSKLAELTQELRGEFSATGDGKEILSGFSYWGIGPTIAWDRACNDRFYLVMKESIESFRYRWHQIHFNNIKDRQYHYVSLGVGTGEKDQHILSLLFNVNPDLLYFPVDMSSEMLRLGVQQATRGSQLQGSHVLPIQVDFSIERNVDELRKLLDRVINNSPVLFSLLGNTLANFQQDTELLQTISKLMRPEDRLLLEVATTEELSEEAAQNAAKEYAKTKSFKEFVTSALLQNTDLHIDLNSVFFEGTVEADRGILIKILYRNLTENKIEVMLPDRSVMNFEDQDTIRLYLTRKYASNGIQKTISDCNLVLVDRLHTVLEPRLKNGFGMDLILIAPDSSGINKNPSVANDIWSKR
ncbi:MULTISPECIES: L-histidine N(alpha)-methyltransferase [unclassified Nostoc]|uniref:L-histidine N(alpha)-methyltransferase n=1 Tax=unclassified Nostoc TaxID=2593658 RepID=UPI002AD2665B|nr:MULTISPECIES: L-histidine N(alpha)-methyltransferase [unclassified Nostoc]MDZ8135194.1 L-histidine N(alpha)-methyltransferase [Nostoc sp. DedQUE04]MDZ8211196.1 L-histidine N(alpha)-methyltransferase [Nostoc sp. ChiSLP03a]